MREGRECHSRKEQCEKKDVEGLSRVCPVGRRDVESCANAAGGVDRRSTTEGLGEHAASGHWLMRLRILVFEAWKQNDQSCLLLL